MPEATRHDILEMLDETDRRFLLNVYLHRCLDERLADAFFYRQTGLPPRLTHCTMQAMVDWGLLKQVPYSPDAPPALFLTQRGLSCIRQAYAGGMLEADGLADRSPPKPHELLMHPSIITHQLHLNEFALEFDAYAKDKLEYRYFDGKFMPPTSIALMPDGVISTPEAILFIETDMGTESIRRMEQKWESYRVFLNDPSPFYRGKDVWMFFVLEGIKNIETRTRTVAKSILPFLLDRINGHFEVFIADRQRCHEIIQARLLHDSSSSCDADRFVPRDIENRHGFLASRASFMDASAYHFDAYIRKKDDAGHIYISNGRPQEFLVDRWLDLRLSAVRTASQLKQVSRISKQLIGRDIPYIMICPDEKRVALLYKLIGGPGVPLPFFTTPERLRTRPWNEALFSIDQLGNMHHFTDDGLSVPVHEKRLLRRVPCR